MNKKLLILVLLCFSFVMIAVGLVVSKEMTIRTGTTILLETIPVDPRDLLRGDYVMLNYRISNIDTSLLSGEHSFNPAQTVYVGLEKDGDFWNAVAISSSKPGQGTFISGRVKHSYGGHVIIEYGLESYFMPEGEGRSIEQMMRGANSSLSVEVVVDSQGKAIIKRLIPKEVQLWQRSINKPVNIEKPGYVPIESLLQGNDWDVAVKFDAADYNDFFPFDRNPGQLGKVYYAKLNQDDFLYEDYVGAECCSGGGYASIYEKEKARRAKAWYVERNQVSPTEYKVSIRGFSKADCGLGGKPYARGELVINEKTGWHIDKVNRQTYSESKIGQETYFVQKGNTIQFASGQGCNGCCACVDGAVLDIDITVKKQ